MPTFLEISNQVNRTIGLQGTILNVESPLGVQNNIVEAVRSSWVDLQNMREDWTFMQGSVTLFSTTASQSIYTPDQVFGTALAAADLNTWKRKRGVFYKQRPLDYVDYEDVPFIENTRETIPRWYSINPGNNSLIFELPDDAYNMDIRYNRAVQTLLVNGDVPFIPPSYHDAIAFKAVQRVAAFVGNSGLYQEYSREANIQFGQLTRNFIKARTIYPRSFV